MPDRIAATGSTATGSMIDLPSLCRNFIVASVRSQGQVAVDDATANAPAKSVAVPPKVRALYEIVPTKTADAAAR
ncbi:hypothetical protein GCM10025774_18660 [Microbacterium kyungheense]